MIFYAKFVIGFVIMLFFSMLVEGLIVSKWLRLSVNQKFLQVLLLSVLIPWIVQLAAIGIGQFSLLLMYPLLFSPWLLKIFNYHYFYPAKSKKTIFVALFIAASISIVGNLILEAGRLSS